jgi:hypothetical protein
MPDQLYEYGSSPVLTDTVRNAAGTIVDPATLRFRFKNPAGTITTYIYGTDAQLVRSATGVYYVQLLCESAGFWSWEYKATTPDCVLQGRFKIKDSLL